LFTLYANSSDQLKYVLYCSNCKATITVETIIDPQSAAHFEALNCPNCQTLTGKIRADKGYNVTNVELAK